MVSDGIDRLRGEKSASRLGPNYGRVTAYRPSVWMPVVRQIVAPALKGFLST